MKIQSINRKYFTSTFDCMLIINFVHYFQSEHFNFKRFLIGTQQNQQKPKFEHFYTNSQFDLIQNPNIESYLYSIRFFDSNYNDFPPAYDCMFFIHSNDGDMWSEKKNWQPNCVRKEKSQTKSLVRFWLYDCISRWFNHLCRTERFHCQCDKQVYYIERNCEFNSLNFFFIRSSRCCLAEKSGVKYARDNISNHDK